jgi:hypothetical protein
MPQPIDKLGHELRQALRFGWVEDPAYGHGIAAVLASFIVIKLAHDRRVQPPDQF